MHLQEHQKSMLFDACNLCLNFLLNVWKLEAKTVLACITTVLEKVFKCAANAERGISIIYTCLQSSIKHKVHTIFFNKDR